MSAALKLEVFQNGELLRAVSLGEEEVSLGRDQACVLRLHDRAISRKHAVFRSTPQGVEFEKRSKFGSVLVNGVSAEHSTLKSGDRVEMGPYELRVSAETAPEVVAAIQKVVQAAAPMITELAEPTQILDGLSENEFGELNIDPVIENGFANTVGIEPLTIEPAPERTQFLNPPIEPVEPENKNTGIFDFSAVQNSSVTRVFAAPEKDMKAILEFSDGAANASQFEITEREIAIGRSQKCHVVLEDKRSSRKHAIISRQHGKFYLKDLGSANGTLLNGIKVDEQELQSGDEVQIGDTPFVFKMVQADYEQKKDQFIRLAPEPVAPEPPPMPQMVSFAEAPSFHNPQANPTAPEEFPASKEKKKSFIGKFLDRYRAMNTKQQIIYGAGILAVVWFMLDEDPVEKKVRLNTGTARPKVSQTKKGEKAIATGPSFESLTPEQQRYIDTEYQLGFDLFKNREYDSALLEIGKIFSLVQDYKNAREIEAFAREGKRKLEAQEEERKKKEAERQAQLKLQSLIEQVSMLMDKKRFIEAEALFPEIELLQPENVAVSEWRKQMIAEHEKLDKELAEKKRLEIANRVAWVDYQKIGELVKTQKYWDALDAFDEILDRKISDRKLIGMIQSETHRVEGLIAAERDPLLVQGKEFESAGKLSEAYRAYQKAYEIDSTNLEAPEGMKRIRGTLTGRAKSIYAEGVFAESYSDLETAEKRYHEVMDVVPNDDDYYLKAEKRLKKLTVFRKPATGESLQ